MVRILIADADDDVRALYRGLLEPAGFTVEEALDGRDAMTRALVDPPSLVITEAHLPYVDGFSLCEILRRDLAARSVRILVVTGEARPTQHDRLRTSGADAILVKPVSPETILGEVRRLAAQAGRAAVRTTPPRAHPHPPEATTRREALKRAHRRYTTTAPPVAPPEVRCPSCDRTLTYRRSHIGGVSGRRSEQWDEFSCDRCGLFEYRHRTRKLRRVW